MPDSLVEIAAVADDRYRTYLVAGTVEPFFLGRAVTALAPLVTMTPPVTVAPARRG